MSDYFKENPHPTVEDHYHIQNLINRQTQRTKEKVAYQEAKKNQQAWQDLLKGFKDIELLDFWCDRCQIDFTARAKRQVDSWDKIAYYKTKHRCGEWAIRHITHRFRDAYFFRSKKVAYDRATNSREMLQPFQTGFNMMYGKKNN